MEKDEYQIWAEEHRKQELEKAYLAVKVGKPIEEIINLLARNLTNKLLYPLYKTVKDKKEPYNPEQCRQDYKKNYLDKIEPVADQVGDRYFDNSKEK